MKGKYTAYQRLAPIEQDFGDDLVQAEQQGFKYREEDSKKRKAFDDKYGLNEDDYYLGDTEFRTVNDVGLETMNMYRDQHYNIYKELKNDPNNIELQKKYGTIKNSVNMLKEVHGKMKTVGEDYLKKVNNNEISGVHENAWREKLEAYDDGRVVVEPDEKGMPKLKFYDKEGNLTDAQNMKELISGSLYSKVNVPNETVAIVERLGRKAVDESTGGFVVTYDEWGTKQETTTNELLKAYSQSDEMVADILNQMTNGESIQEEGFTEQQREKVRQYMYNLVKGSYDEEQQKKPYNRPQPSQGSYGNSMKMKANLVVCRDNFRYPLLKIVEFQHLELCEKSFIWNAMQVH